MVCPPHLTSLGDTWQVLIPCVDRLLYPCLDRLGIRLGMLTKIGIGFGFAAASVAVAGGVERMRKAAPELPLPPFVPGNVSVGLCGSGGDTPPLPMSELTIWWQIPQYMLIGMSEIFAAITCYELFYSTVPPHLRSVCQSMNLLCTAFGSLAAAGLNSACAAWIPNNLNDGHLDYVFFLLCGLMVADLALFVLVGARFARHANLDGEYAAAPLLRDPSLAIVDSIAPGVRLSSATLERLSGTRGTLSSRHSAPSRISGAVEGRELENPLMPDER